MQEPDFVWTTRPATLTWQSNVEPCSLAGGDLALSNLAATGSTSSTQANAGDVTYTLTCGAAGNQASITRQIDFVTPSLIFEQTGSDRILGEDYQLAWRTYADSCVESGGAPGDGWGSTAFNTSINPAAVFFPRVTTVGTYTYTLTCSSGDISLAQSLTVTFENDVPYVSASLTPTTVTYTDSPADYVTLSWNSNLSGCTLDSDPTIVFSSNDPLSIPFPAQAMATGQPSAPGTYMVSVKCGLQEFSSTPITLTVLPPAAPTATLLISPSTVSAGQPFTVTWTSMNSNSCFGTDGIPMTGWYTGDGYGPPTGTYTYTPAAPLQLGNFTFTLTCVGLYADVAEASVQAQLTVQASNSSSGGSNGSGSHGGGAFGGMELALLSGLLWFKESRKRSKRAQFAIRNSCT